MSTLADRRRINGPPGGTTTPAFDKGKPSVDSIPTGQAERTPKDIRKIFLRTGLISSTSGSSFLEISPLKISVSVLGPRPLPRSASVPFTSHALLTTEVKFAPFACPVRRGYVRDSSERDLSARLYQALVGSIRTELYPKSRIEIVVTVLDSEGAGNDEQTSVLAGCITASSAALADAGIECFDLVAGGVCALYDDGEVVVDPPALSSSQVSNDSVEKTKQRVATCVVGHMGGRDEITELWMVGKIGGAMMERLMDGAVEAAVKARMVLNIAAAERVKFIVEKGGTTAQKEERDVEMSG